MADTSDDFRKQMLGMGIVSYTQQDTLWDIGKRCARSGGIVTAGGVAALGAGAGAVTVPGIGSVPGAVAGMLAGMVMGTGACMAVNVRHRNALRQLLDEQ